MKLLLFDQNLSPRLVSRLADLYPGSEFARLNRFIIVTKDADFSELSVLLGTPPKVIWIRRGNCSTKEVEELLRDSYAAINEFGNNAVSGVLTLF